MDVKYAYYSTSKGYRVVGGTAAHFLKADGSLDGTSYIPVNTEINMGDKNLNFTSGSLSKFENSSRVFNKVFQNYTQSAQTGILSIKFPQASTAATMFDVTIKIFNYQAAYLGSIRVAFYKQTATVIHSTGRKCLIECTDNFPSTVVNVGMDLSGNICINLGDINTVWNLHTNIEVERVSTTYTGYNFDWSKGWSQTVETVAPVVPTTYQSLVSIPTEIGATRSWINSGLANVVTTNTTQTGLTGDKTTSGTWTFNGATATGINLLRPANTINNSIGIGFDTVSTYFGLADSNTFAVGISNNLSALTNRSFWIDHPTFTANLRGGIGGSGLTAKDIGGFTISTATNNSKAEMILRHVWSAKNQTFGIGGISSPTSGSMSQWGLTKWLNDRTVNGNDGFFGWFGDTDILRATSLAGTGTRMVTADSSGILSTQIIPAIPTAQNLSTNPTIAGTIDISGGGTSANLQSLLPISKSDANVRSMRNEMQPYFTSGGSVNYPSQIGAGIRVERYSSASDQRGFNIWSAGSNGQIYFKTFSGAVSESSFETFASREWANGQFSLLNHTHTFASLTSKPTTLAGYGITDGMSTSHSANGITTTLINNWNNAYNWGNHKAINDNQWLGSDYVSGGLEKPNSHYFGAGKLKLQMLSGGTNNLPTGTDTWNDVLWMSSYNGGDVKKSTAIISSKQSNKIGFVKQDYDATDWGNYIEFLTSESGGFLPYSKNLDTLNANTLQGTKLYTSTDNWSNKPSWTSSGSGSLLNINTYYDVPDHEFQMYMDTYSDSIGFRSKFGSATFSDWNKIITRTKGIFTNTTRVVSQGTSDLNLSNEGINAKMVLANGNDETPVYGMKFGVENDGSGHIQQQRFDGTSGAYRLNLQPLGGELYYGNSEVATKNFLSSNYALRSGENAIDTWINSSMSLLQNPSTSGKMFNAAGNQSDLLTATYGTVAGFINTSGIASGNPTQDWHYRMKFLHSNSAGYYGEIAVQMTGANALRYKRYEGGTDFGWVKVWDEQNLPDYRLYGLGTTASVHAPDLNNITHTSILSMSDSANSPFGYGSVYHHQKDGGEFTQMAINVLNGSSYTRGYSSGFGDTGWKKNWNESDFNYTDIGNWSNAYSNSLMSRGVSFVNNIDANTLTQGTEIMSIELPNGTGNTNFPFNNYGTFMRFKSNSFTSDFAHEHNGRLFIRNWYNPDAIGSTVWREVWDSVSLPNPVTLSDLNGYATETWVNTNFIPKTHPIYNVTQNNINSWNTAAANTHTHSNLGFLNNIDQWLGVGQAPQFSSVRLMNSLGYGTLALEEDYVGGELGLIDLSNDVVYAGRVNEYLKYGSDVYGSQGLNIHFDSRLVTVGKEITNGEDKVQIAGNISVDTVNISDVPTELVLNPLYNTDGNVRRSRNAHIYIVTRNTVRLPDKPILGQRIEIFNDSDSDIEVTHGNVGTMFHVPGFCKVTGIAANKGFKFDAEPVYTKQYDI